MNFGLNSIGTRLFLAIMAGTSLGLGFLGYLSYQKLQTLSLQELRANLNSEVQTLDGQLRSSEHFLRGLAAATQVMHQSPNSSSQTYQQLVLAFMQARPEIITGFGLMQTPYGLVDKRWFGPYIEESLANRGTPLSENPQFSFVELWEADRYPDLNYYRDALTQPTYKWGEPYVNEVYPIPLMTFSGQISDSKGKPIAVLNGDINLSDLNRIAAKQPAKGSGYFVVVTQRGALLAYPPHPRKATKLETIQSIPTLQPLWADVQRAIARNETTGLLISAVDQRYWAYQVVPRTGWVVMATISFRAVMVPALIASGSGIVVVALFLGGVVWLFTRSLTRRLQPILAACETAIAPTASLPLNTPENIATFVPSVEANPIIKFHTYDEIDQLSYAFFGLLHQQTTLLDQLTQKNTELLEATRLKDEFLANMSHELRTPLNAILGLSECLKEELLGPLNQRQHRSVQTIETSGRHLLELINDILDLAKLESGHMTLSLDTVDLAALCERSVSLVGQLARTKNLHLSTHFAPQLGWIQADERRLRQALINLLSNAIKFTPEGGLISLSATVERPLDPDYGIPTAKPETVTSETVVLAVKDTGIGITPEDQAKLFKPFVQIDSRLNRQYQGTGLGLALVQHIATLHGGAVTLSSEVGVGSCFSLRLPRELELSEEAMGFSEIQRLASPGAVVGTTDGLAGGDVVQKPPALGMTPAPMSSTLPSPLILVAEDDPRNLETIAIYLKSSGYRLIHAANGCEAIDLTQRYHPDLILMDIQMPGMDGLDAIRQLRSLEPYATLPIIALTALALDGDRDRCLAAGATAYLTKPISLKSLTTGIRQYLPLSALPDLSIR